MRKINRTILLIQAIFAAALLMAPASVFGQGTGQTPPSQSVPSGQGLSLTMEDEHVLKEILLKDSNIPHTSQPAPKIGGTVANSVKLQDFPEEISSKVPKVKSHEFFIAAGDAIVIVRPQGRLVADVIK